MPVPRLCYAARQRAEPFRRASPAQKKAPLSKGDSPQCGEMSRSDRGARARRAGRVSGLGDSDGPCLIAHHTRIRPGIPPPCLRSAPPFDKGGFLRGASGTPPTFLVKKLTAQILKKFNSQMQQLFAYIFVHFITPQQSRQHSLFCWQPVITPILLHRL